MKNLSPAKWQLLLIFTFLCLFVLVVPLATYAQPGLPLAPAQDAPIGGGLGILAAIGGTYAIKKLKGNR